MSLELEEQSYLLRRCFFDVQNEIGRGRQEEDYHQACVLCFQERGLPIVSRLPHRLFLRGEEAICIFPDFVGWDSISVELKAVPRHLNNTELAQLFNYLKCRGDRLGLLVNMGLDRVEIERIIYEPRPSEWIERWDSWSGQIEGEDRAIGLEVRKALYAVYCEHTTGYANDILSRLIHHALKQQGLLVRQQPIVKTYYRGVEIHESALDGIVINERILLSFTALFDGNVFNINRGKSYLKALGLNWGIAADFGRIRAEVVGFRID